MTVFRRVLLSWQFWLLPFIFMCMPVNFTGYMLNH